MANQPGSHEGKEAVGAGKASFLHQELPALPATAILPVFVLQEIVDIEVSHAFIILAGYAPSGMYPTTSCPPSHPRKLKYIGLSTTMFGPEVTLTRTDNW